MNQKEYLGIIIIKIKTMHNIGDGKVCSGKYIAFNTCILKWKRSNKSVFTQEAINGIIQYI